MFHSQQILGDKLLLISKKKKWFIGWLKLKLIIIFYKKKTIKIYQLWFVKKVL